MTMATPAASQAAKTSSSRIEPPGWMIAFTPGRRRRLGAVGEREERVAGEHRAVHRHLGLLERQAHRVDPAHLPGADAHRREVAREHDRVALTCFATRQANSRSPHSASVGARCVTTVMCVAVLALVVAVLHEQAAGHPAQVALARVGRAAARRCSMMRVLGLRVSASRAASS